MSDSSTLDIPSARVAEGKMKLAQESKAKVADIRKQIKLGVEKMIVSGDRRGLTPLGPQHV